MRDPGKGLVEGGGLQVTDQGQTVVWRQDPSRRLEFLIQLCFIFNDFFYILKYITLANGLSIIFQFLLI